MNTRRSRRDLELSGASPAVEGPAPSWGEGPEPGSAAERLAYSVSEAARLTGLSRDLLYDEMRRGHLHYIKVGRRRLITRHHLEQFLGIGPQPVLSPPQRVRS